MLALGAWPHAGLGGDPDQPAGCRVSTESTMSTARRGARLGHEEVHRRAQERRLHPVVLRASREQHGRVPGLGARASAMTARPFIPGMW